MTFNAGHPKRRTWGKHHPSNLFKKSSGLIEVYGAVLDEGDDLLADYLRRAGPAAPKVRAAHQEDLGVGKYRLFAYMLNGQGERHGCGIFCQCRHSFFTQRRH
ncbi:hypothetical protein D3C76_610930 [compost metagenome]